MPCFEHILLIYSKGLGTSFGNLLPPFPLLSKTYNTGHDKVLTYKYLSDEDFEKHQSSFGTIFLTAISSPKLNSHNIVARQHAKSENPTGEWVNIFFHKIL
jgi:hypothetical protein